MATVIDIVQRALADGMANRPAVQGFPYLAEALRRAGVRRNVWNLPSLQSLYETDNGAVINQGVPLLKGMAEVNPFDEDALIDALRTDQAGRSTFAEFAAAAWRAGVVRYVVDLDRRTCTYYGWDGQHFEETYPGVSIPVAVTHSR